MPKQRRSSGLVAGSRLPERWQSIARWRHRGSADIRPSPKRQKGGSGTWPGKPLLRTHARLPAATRRCSSRVARGVGDRIDESALSHRDVFSASTSAVRRRAASGSTAIPARPRT